MTDRATEIWARVWRPQTDDLEHLPLVVFLHGNHGTCGTFNCSVANCGRFIPLPNGPRIDDRIDYTFFGTCPRAGEGSPPAEFDYVVTVTQNRVGTFLTIMALLCALGWKLKDAMQIIESRRPQADFADVYVRSVERFLQGYLAAKK